MLQYLDGYGLASCTAAATGWAAAAGSNMFRWQIGFFFTTDKLTCTSTHPMSLSYFKKLFQAPHGDVMIFFMRQDDIIGAARFIDACLERVHTSAGPPMGAQASDQP